MRSRRSVTLQPIGMPSRSLNWAIDFLALVITGFWPAICCISVGRGLDLLLVLGRFADAHVDDDLVEPRDLELVLVTELLDHRRRRCARHSRRGGAGCSPSAHAEPSRPCRPSPRPRPFRLWPRPFRPWLQRARPAGRSQPARPQPALGLLRLLRGLLDLGLFDLVFVVSHGSALRTWPQRGPSCRRASRSGRGSPCRLGVGDRDVRDVQRRFLALDAALRVGLATACGGARGR